METDDKRYDEGNREGNPGNFNPQDVDFEHPAKKEKAQEKVDIKESEIGRETSQQPANEQIEPMSQIDDDTKKLQEEKTVQKETGAEQEEEDAGTDKGRDSSGYMNDVTSDENRK